MANRYIDATLRFFDKFTGPMKKATDKIQAQNKSIVGYGKGLQRTGKDISKIGSNMTRHLTLPIAAAGYAAGKLYTDFSHEMTRVNTLLDDPSHLKSYQDAVMRVSSETGESAKTTASGMYRAVSVMGDHGKQTQKIFEQMAKSAKAGGADIQDSVAMIASAMKGYGDVSESNAKKISDLAFNTVKLGDTTFPELAASMQPLFPLSNALNMSYEELYGTMSTLTGVTGNTAQVSTQMKGFMSALIKPSDAMSKMMAKYGYSSGEAMLKARGLSGVLKLVRKETGGSSTEMGKLFKNQRALIAATALAGQQYDTYNEKTNKLRKSTGATQAAFEKMEGTPALKLEKAMTRMKNAGIQFGGALMQVVVPFMEEFGRVMEKVERGLANMSPGMQQFIVKSLLAAAAIGPLLKGVGGMIKGYGTLVVTIGKIGGKLDQMTMKIAQSTATSGMIGRLTGAFRKLQGEIKVAGSAQVFLGNKMRDLKYSGGALGKVANLFMNPWVIAIMAIIAVLAILWKHNKAFRDGVKKIWKDIGKALAPAVTELKRSFDGLKKAMAPIAKFAKAQLSESFKELKKAFEPLAKKIGPALAVAIRAIGKAAQVVAPILGKILIVEIKIIIEVIIIAIKIISGVIKVITAIVKAIMGIPEAFAKLKSSISGGVKFIANKFKDFGSKAKEYFGRRWKSTVDGAVSIGGKMKNGFKKSFDAIGKLSKKLEKTCGDSTHGMKGYFGGMNKFISGVFSGDWKKAWQGIVQVFKTIWNGIVSVAKTPINLVIGMINTLIRGIDKISFTVPDKKWVPKAFRGSHFGINIAEIPKLYKGTSDWTGGPATVNDRGGEIIDLPRGSRVYPHDISKKMAGEKNIKIEINIDSPVVRDEGDIDTLVSRIAEKLEPVLENVALE